mgnify:CR=1 FL=1
MYLFLSTDHFKESKVRIINKNLIDKLSQFGEKPSETELDKLLTVSYKVLDEKFNVISSKSFIVKSDEKFTKEALDIINTFDEIDESKFEFVFKTDLIKTLKTDIKSSKYLISHYNEFHKDLIINETGKIEDREYEHEYEKEYSRVYNLEYDLFEELIEIDILKDSMCFAKKTMHKKGNRLKFPNTSEVYKWLFKNEPKLTNSYLNVNVLIECFKELNNRGLTYQTYPSIDFVDKLIKSKVNTYLDLQEQKD